MTSRYAESMVLTVLEKNCASKLWMSSVCAYMLDNAREMTVPKLTGRTYDLKFACKQFGVDPLHASCLRIAVKKLGGGVVFFSALALPFGATGSVSSFLRVSASLTFIGVVAVQILWAVFLMITHVCAWKVKNAMFRFTLSRSSECLEFGSRKLGRKPFRSGRCSGRLACFLILGNLVCWIFFLETH